jgi:hypothetical protein
MEKRGRGTSNSDGASRVRRSPMASLANMFASELTT